MALKPTSAWTLGTAGACVALSAASWFLLIAPERAEAAATREQTVAAQQSNAQLEVRIEQLRREYADLPARQAELAAVRQALPEEPALAALVREVNEAATDAGVTLDGLTSGAAAVVVDPAALTAVAPAPAAAPAEGTTDAGTTDAGTTDAGTTDAGTTDAGTTDAGTTDAGTTDAGATDPAAPTGTDPAVAAVPGAPGGPVLAFVPLTIDTTAGFHQSTLFLKALQSDISRALLVDNLTVTVVEGEEADEPGTVRTTVSARVFVFVDPDGVDGLEAVAVPTE